MAQHTSTAGPVDPYVISLIRTAVPAVWGYLTSRLVDLGISSAWLAGWHDTALTALTAALTVAWYALWRWIELKVPAADHLAARLVVILALGHPARPAYLSTPVAAHAAPSPVK